MAEKKKSFNQMLKDAETPVLVDFYADWCGPCKAMEPVIKEVARKQQDKIKVVKINVDRNQQAAMQYGIRGIPTFIIFDKGKPVWRHSGMIRQNDLEKIIEQNAS